MDQKVVDLEDRRKTIEAIIAICGNNETAFYNIQQCIPSLSNITWDQVQIYQQVLDYEMKKAETAQEKQR